VGAAPLTFSYGPLGHEVLLGAARRSQRGRFGGPDCQVGPPGVPWGHQLAALVAGGTGRRFEQRSGGPGVDRREPALRQRMARVGAQSIPLGPMIRRGHPIENDTLPRNPSWTDFPGTSLGGGGNTMVDGRVLSFPSAATGAGRPCPYIQIQGRERTLLGPPSCLRPLLWHTEARRPDSGRYSPPIDRPARKMSVRSYGPRIH